MAHDLRLPLAGTTPAGRARAALACHPSLAWVAGGRAGVAPYYEQVGAPMLFATEEDAARMLEAGAGRVELGLHPRLGLLRLAGQFWPVIGHQAQAMLTAVHDQHADCPNCPSRDFTRVIGVHVVTAAIRLPGDHDHRPIAVDDYLIAQPDPLIAVGAATAAHLSADHAEELRTFAAGILGPSADVLAASVGAVDSGGFELFVVDETGSRLVVVPFWPQPIDERQLQSCFRIALAAFAGRSDPPGC